MRGWRNLLWLAGLTAVYLVAGRLGLSLAFEHPSATPVWAPTGIALAACLILGTRVWPAIFVGAFLVNLTTQGTILTSLGIAVGNTLEALIGAHLVTRWAGGTRALEHARTAFVYVLVIAAIATTVSATIGVTTLALAGLAAPKDWSGMWLTWWLGDTTGALVVTPVLLLWNSNWRLRWDLVRAIEATGLAVAVIFTGLLVFSELTPLNDARSPSEFITMPVLLWAAFRFGPRESATAVLVLSGIAIAGTLDGHGPFSWSTPNGSLLLLQAFMGVAAATTLIFAAAMSERRAAERQLREWSLKDPLTGLANHRQMVAVLDAEVRRSQRTGRPFALLVLDLDDLKSINDRYGHLVGSRALCRLATTLQGAVRAVDTAARFGGDEFAVILPETEETEARNLAVRIAERLARDPESPPISASAGVAVSPQDGDTVEELIGAADSRLYSAKGRRSRSKSTTPTRST